MFINQNESQENQEIVEDRIEKSELKKDWMFHEYRSTTQNTERECVV